MSRAPARPSPIHKQAWIFAAFSAILVCGAYASNRAAFRHPDFRQSPPLQPVADSQLLAPSVERPTQSQYTADECDCGSAYLCEYPRECRNTGLSSCTVSDTTCLCLETSLTSCMSSYDCLHGDRCTNSSRFSSGLYCISCSLVHATIDYMPLDSGYGNCPGSDPGGGSNGGHDDYASPVPTFESDPGPTDDGATGDECTVTSDNCEYPRKCVDSGNLLETCSSSSSFCFCASLDNWFCTNSRDCLQGDRCIENPPDQSTFCFSCKLSENYDVDYVDDGEGKCESGDSDDYPSPSSPPCWERDQNVWLKIVGLVHIELKTWNRLLFQRVPEIRGKQIASPRFAR